jgi:2,4-diaminopentanoate dehydrogenase
LSSSTAGKPRIAIYGTGQYGLEAARIALKKGWPIVAAFNRAGPKVGQDLGRLAGLDRDLGVRTTARSRRTSPSMPSTIG